MRSYYSGKEVNPSRAREEAEVTAPSRSRLCVSFVPGSYSEAADSFSANIEKL